VRDYLYYVLGGLLLALIDFRINELDLLPDFVGWGIVGYAAKKLAPLSQQFFSASILAGVLAALDLIGMFGSGWLLGLVATFANCGFIWLFLGGLFEVAFSHNRADLAASADYLRTAYVCVAIAAFGLTLLVSGSRNALAVVLIVGLAVTWLIVMILIFRLIHRTANELPL
jgi:hypothetical protein